MAEPPAKRARRTDSAGMWAREHPASPRSPRPHDTRRDEGGRPKQDDDRGAKPRRYDEKRRSRSPRGGRDRERERSRSRERAHHGRDRDRDRYRDRERTGHDRRDRDQDRDRNSDRKPARPERQRSRSPTRNGTSRPTREQSPGPARSKHDRPGARETKTEPEDKPDVNGNTEMDVDEDDEDAKMRRVMGITSFRTTKNTKVPGNQIYGVRKEKKTVYRQYMNRTGGFNRPLSPGR